MSSTFSPNTVAATFVVPTATRAAPTPAAETFIALDLLWPMSVEQYHQLAAAGILKDGDPLELLEGRLVKKMTKNRRHSFVTQELLELLRRQLPTGYFIESQEPLALSNSEPEPDLAIFQGSRHDFMQRKPGPAEARLVVEVAESSLTIDQAWKLGIYAAAGIPQYWIVNLVENRLEQYTEPAVTGEKGTYRQRQDYALGSTLSFLLGGQELRIAVNEQLIPAFSV